MTVLFYGSVREHTNNEKSIEIETANCLHALIDILGKHFGEQFKDFLLEDKTCFFLVNGSGIISTGGLKTPLKSNDKVEVLPYADAG